MSMSLVAASVPAFAAGSVDPQKLQQKIAEGVGAITEFRRLRDLAEAAGLKVYLAGGTASSLANHARHQLLSEKGSAGPVKQRLENQLGLVLREGQDIDIVVDGSPEAVAKLESSFRAGNNDGMKWEFRSLRSDARGHAVFGSKEFNRQHLDSMSIGLIRVDGKEAGAVSDVKDPTGNAFLADAADGRIRFLKGVDGGADNPPALSAIRFLRKLVQYDLEASPADLDEIKGMLKPSALLEGPGTAYAKARIEKEISKMAKLAGDLNKSRKLLEKLGLLKTLQKSPHLDEEIRALFNREPLPDVPLGRSGKTAAQLGINRLTHFTEGFDAFDSITMGYGAHPNLLSSRRGADGETAVYGNGFYAGVGDAGFLKNGSGKPAIAVQLQLDPGARAGVDFELVPGGWIRVLNRRAVTLDPDTFRQFGQYYPTAKEYFRVIKQKNWPYFSHTALLRQLGNAPGITATQKELRELSAMVRAELKKPFSGSTSAGFSDPGRKSMNVDLVMAALSYRPLHEHDPALLGDVMKEIGGDKEIMNFLRATTFQHPDWRKDPRLLETILGLMENSRNDVGYSSLLADLLQSEHTLNNPRAPDGIRRLFEGPRRLDFTEALEAMNAQPGWARSAHAAEIGEIIAKAFANHRHMAKFKVKPYLANFLMTDGWRDLPKRDEWLRALPAAVAEYSPLDGYLTVLKTIEEEGLAANLSPAEKKRLLATVTATLPENLKGRLKEILPRLAPGFVFTAKAGCGPEFAKLKGKKASAR